MRVVWSPASIIEIGHIRDYLADFNPRAAQAVAAALIGAGDSLAILPDRGRPVGDGLRELTTVWPYVIRYEIDGDEVRILRVRHGMRSR
jgi:plasmid stabilization system protein ParE